MQMRVKCLFRQVAAAEGTEAAAPLVAMTSGDRAVKEAVEAGEVWGAEWAGRSPE